MLSIVALVVLSGSHDYALLFGGVVVGIALLIVLRTKFVVLAWTMTFGPSQEAGRARLE